VRPLPATARAVLCSIFGIVPIVVIVIVIMATSVRILRDYE
jgi:hypothetical protein